MTTDHRRICIIVSAFNDEASIGELSHRLAQVFDLRSDYEWEAVLVDNGSDDGTYKQIGLVLDRDPRFKAVQLARHFDHDGGFSAGLASADADAVVLMHADLEDPPEMIPGFIDRWEEGFENVYALEPPRVGSSKGWWPGWASVRRVLSGRSGLSRRRPSIPAEPDASSGRSAQFLPTRKSP
jgi:dolichol-phosphate mannosyltransferase